MFRCIHKEVSWNKNAPQKVAKMCEKYTSRWKLHKFNKSELLQIIFYYKALRYPLMLPVNVIVHHKLLEKRFRIPFPYWEYIHSEVICAEFIARYLFDKCAYAKRQKQFPRGLLWKRCSANMQRIYRRTPCRRKISIKLHWKFSWYLQNTSGGLILEESNMTHNINKHLFSENLY